MELKQSIKKGARKKNYFLCKTCCMLDGCFQDEIFKDFEEVICVKTNKLMMMMRDRIDRF